MAKNPHAIVPLRLKPLGTGFNSRSLPELCEDNLWRLLLNSAFNERGSLCRAPGYQKFLNGFITDRSYNREDLSDQLLSLQQYYDAIAEASLTAAPLVADRQYVVTKFFSGDNFLNVGAASNTQGVKFTATGTTPTTWTHGSVLTQLVPDDASVVTFPPNNSDFATFCGTTLKTRTQGRQPITFMAEVTSTAGTRMLLRGTQSRLYELLIGKGNHRILCDGLGGILDNPEIRLRHSQVADFVLFTNNYDDPFYWTVGAGAEGCAMNSTHLIPELQAIGLRKALVTFQYRGILFLANTEEDGQRKGSMVRWSGADPLNWIEDPGFSLAGHFELDFGEDVLAGEVIGDFAYLHTTRGTWQLSVSPDATIIFSFTKLYTGPSGEGCITYPYTFVSTGGAHFYMAKDGIYEFSPIYPTPRRVDWIHNSSNILYDDLNKSRCAVHTAGFDPINQELYFSCALGVDKLPSVTLLCNARYNACSKLDYGATSFLSCTPSKAPSYRDWLIDNCLCSEATLESAELQAIGFATIKEGAGQPKTSPPCTDYPASICQKVTLGPNILSGTYNGESEYEFSGLLVGQRYLLTIGVAETEAGGVFQNGIGHIGSDFPTLTGTVIFTAFDTVGTVTGPALAAVTTTIQTIIGGITVDNVLLEDYTAEQCDEDSVCGFLPPGTISDLCLDCEAETKFTFTSALDYCVKEIAGLSREVYAPTTDSYSFSGYRTEFWKLLTLSSSDPKTLQRVALEFDAAEALIPLSLNLRTGRSVRVQDPIKGPNNCQIHWHDEGARVLSCKADDRALQWQTFLRGEVLYLNFWIDGKGGASCFSSLQLDVMNDPRHI